MRILHILADGQTDLSSRMIETQSEEHDVMVIDLSKREISYEALVEEIFCRDKVVSWHR